MFELSLTVSTLLPSLTPGALTGAGKGLGVLLLGAFEITLSIALIMGLLAWTSAVTTLTVRLV